MSGQKVTYVNITQREYQRFMRTSRELERVEDRVKREMSNHSQQMKRRIQEVERRAENRINNQNRIIDKLNSNMKKIERDFQNRFQAQEERHRQDIEDLDYKIDFEISMLETRLDEQREEYLSLIEEQGKFLNSKIDDLARSIEEREKSREHQAKEWLKNAEDALALVKTYRHEKFTPNRYEELKSRLELVKSNIQNGNYEISNLQNIWMDSYKLRAELEQKENEWNIYLEEALEANTKLLATCDAQESVKLAFDTEDGVEELEIEIDYWSDGELSRLKEKAMSDAKRLENSDSLEIEDFKEILKSSEELQERVLGLTERAKEAIVLSQVRSDIASDVVEALEDSGFELVDSCFSGDDERRSIHLKLQNAPGDEIVTIITPEDNVVNKLDIHFFDESDENLKQVRLKSIIQRLKDNGVEYTEPSCASGMENSPVGDEKVRNFEKIRQRG